MQTTPPYLKYIPLLIHVITIPSILFGDNIKPGIKAGYQQVKNGCGRYFIVSQANSENICGSIFIINCGHARGTKGQLHVIGQKLNHVHSVAEEDFSWRD